MKVIYSINNITNTKRYIGKSQFFITRMNDHLRHLRKNNHVNKHLQRAWNKYSESNFTIEILEFVKDKEKLNEREIYWIQYHDSSNPKSGYNKTIGGDGGNSNEETRKKISEKVKGVNHPFYGKKGHLAAHYGKQHTDEAREKIRIGNLGKTISRETRKKIGDALKGRKLTEETKMKISLALTGENNPFYGKKHTEESKLKMSKSHEGNTAFKDKKHTDEAKKKMSDSKIGKVPWNKGKKASEDAKKNMSNAQKGRISWNKGKKSSEETKQKVSENHASKIRFTNEQVENIIHLIKNGEKINNVARLYNCSAKPIFRILDENQIKYSDFANLRKILKKSKN